MSQKFPLHVNESKSLPYTLRKFPNTHKKLEPQTTPAK